MPRRRLPRIQVVEYLRAFMIGRAGWSRLGGLLIISGAFGVFRRDVLFELGGLAHDCIGEDAELVVRLHRWLGETEAPGRVVFVSEPVAWTEVPQSRAVLRRQRRRWHRGLAEILAKHRGMLLRPRYGVVGMLALPWFVLFELLAPGVEVLGVAYLAVVLLGYGAQALGLLSATLVDPTLIGGLLAASLLYTAVLTLSALLVEELSFRRYHGAGDLGRALWAVVEENLGYRQLTAWWRLGGAWEAVRRARPEWGDMQRQGLGKS
jgi:cellulose synthase/poly-beta-1,6-N-acetylglucosamine synthase-like glycosyltransferase